jgi:5-(carboxyamino)imidazole ribonucleotide synthase
VTRSATVAVVGGGQLGLMLGLAGVPLGCRFRFLDPAPDAPAGRVGELLVGAYDDRSALARLVAGADAVTFEFENLPAAAAPPALVPSARSLATGQDRLAEKRLFRRLGIGTAPFAPVGDPAELDRAVAEIGLPAVLKTRRLGYDGKGQRVLREPDDVRAAWRELGGAPCILEGLVAFRRELSIVAARAADGDTVYYGLAENSHRDGILRLTRAPAAPELQAEAEALAAAVLRELDHVGVLAIELFDDGGALLANELAPRVHNTGHWTIEGAATSQFENHVRAILGLPLGSTAAVGAGAMVNLIGEVPAADELLAVRGARVHLYGKAARPGRKVGHVTLVAPDAAALEPTLEHVLELVGEPTGAGSTIAG